MTQTDAKQAILDLTDGAGADIVIETSGFPSSSARVLDAVRKEGNVAHIGWANDLPDLPRCLDLHCAGRPTGHHSAGPALTAQYGGDFGCC